MEKLNINFRFKTILLMLSFLVGFFVFSDSFAQQNLTEEDRAHLESFSGEVDPTGLGPLAPAEPPSVVTEPIIVDPAQNLDPFATTKIIEGEKLKEARAEVESEAEKGTIKKKEEEKEAKRNTGTPPPVAGYGLLPGPTTGGEAVVFVNNSFFPNISNYALVFLLTLSVLMVVIGGLFYIASSGDSEMKKKGKDIIMWTVIGVAVAILSYTIISLVVNTNFGIG